MQVVDCIRVSFLVLLYNRQDVAAVGNYLGICNYLKIKSLKCYAV